MDYNVNKPVTERLKILFISYGDLPRIFAGKLNIKNIPDYCRIISIHADYMRRGISIVIEHPSFDPIITGTEYKMVAPIIAEYVENKINLNRKLTFD